MLPWRGTRKAVTSAYFQPIYGIHTKSRKFFLDMGYAARRAEVKELDYCETCHFHMNQ
jgi:hypothetical protein